MTAAPEITAPDGDRLLRIADVIDRVGMSRSAIYEKVGEGSFPSPVRLGANSVRWRKSEIEGWIRDLPRARPDEHGR